MIVAHRVFAHVDLADASPTVYIGLVVRETTHQIHFYQMRELAPPSYTMPVHSGLRPSRLYKSPNLFMSEPLTYSAAIDRMTALQVTLTAAAGPIRNQLAEAKASYDQMVAMAATYTRTVIEAKGVKATSQETMQ
jgi:hypothetical protein